MDSASVGQLVDILVVLSVRHSVELMETVMGYVKVLNSAAHSVHRKAVD